MSPMTVVIVSSLCIFLGGILLRYVMPVEEFGAQGGEMVQLAAGHVPTMEDVRAQAQEARQMKREIVNMTGYW
jgi:hypothetical protein